MVCTFSRLVCFLVLLIRVVPLNGFGVPGSRRMLGLDSKETELRVELGSIPVKLDHTSPKLAGWKEQCQGGNSMLNISCQQGLVCVQIFPYHRISELHSFVGVCANLSDSGSPLATCKFNDKYRGGGCSNGYRCLPQAHLYKQYRIPRTDSVGYCWPSNSTRGGKCRYGGRVEPIVCPKKLVCVTGKLPEFPDSPFEGKCAKKGKNSKTVNASTKSPSTTPSPSPTLPPPSPATTSSSSFTTLSTSESSPTTPITASDVSPPPPTATVPSPEFPPSDSTQNSNSLPHTSTLSTPSSEFTLPPSLDDFHAVFPSDYDFGSPSPSDSSFTPGATSVDMSDGLYIPPVAKGGNCLTTGKFFACEEGLECQMSPNQPEVGQKWGVCIEKP